MFENETEIGRNVENGMIAIVYGCLRKVGN